ncbi:MAG: DNA internalization-related competence protein ComEC/Rec2 [Gammaproteobacteria bacterium]|nr:DNA internalization-related competence protein ComEC/Rec2 [Gammaproteobacteria bacterium]
MTASDALALLGGNLLLQLLPQFPPWSWWWLLLLLPPLLLYRRSPRLSRPLLIATASGLWLLANASALLQQLPPELEGVNLELTGTIASLPSLGEGGRRHLFRVEEGRRLGELVKLPELIRLSWYHDPPSTLRPGERWQLTVRLKRPWGMSNPGTFDYEQWLFHNGIAATGYVRRGEDNRPLGGEGAGPIDRLRYHLYLQLQQRLNDSPYAGVMTALVVGERSGISDAQWQLFLETGTNHLMAISGLHVGLVAGVIFFLARGAWCWFPGGTTLVAAPRFAAIAALLGALLYAALAGFSIPTQRALIMVAVGLGAVLLRRAVSPGQLLSVAMILVILWQPMAPLSPGFWLSFAAVAAIFYFVRRSGSPKGMVARLWQLLLLQMILFLTLLPLLAHHFGQVSLLAPLANLIAVPFVGMVIVPLLLLGVVLLALHPLLADPFLHFSALLMGWLLQFLQQLQPLAPPYLLHSPGLGATLLALLGAIWLTAPRGWPGRALGVIAFVPLLFTLPPRPDPGEARVTVVDVGQGLATLVETRNHLLIFDTGPRFPSGFNTGSAVIVPMLRARGRTQVDRLIISHGDIDHIGGARAVSEEMTVAQILTSVPEAVEWAASRPCYRGESWQWDGVAFRLIHPPRQQAATTSENDLSCVLQITAGEESLLLTGDIEAAAERSLVAAEGAALHSTYLVVPHHGSRTSSTPAFIEQVSPRWAIIPAGRRNRFRFPHPEVEARYRQAGASTVVTGDEGAITLTLGATPPVPLQRHRLQQRRYWHSIPTNNSYDRVW